MAQYRGSDDDAADLLYRKVVELADRGATANTVLQQFGDAISDEELETVRASVNIPSWRQGWAVTAGLFRNFPDPGPTPVGWNAPVSDAARLWTLGQMVVSASVGTPMAWAQQQAGNFAHFVVPTPGVESDQVSGSSETKLLWHVEDPFSARRPWLVMLTGLRDTGQVPTLLSHVRGAVKSLSAEQLEILQRPTSSIAVDDSYGVNPTSVALPDAVHTLWDTADGLGLRYDQAFSTPYRLLSGDQRVQVQRALDRLGEGLEAVHEEVLLAPGEFVLFRNDAVAHARPPFTVPPAYDGNDRWLVRTLVTAPEPHRTPREFFERDPISRAGSLAAPAITYARLRRAARQE